MFTFHLKYFGLKRYHLRNVESILGQVVNPSGNCLKVRQNQLKFEKGRLDVSQHETPTEVLALGEM